MKFSNHSFLVLGLVIIGLLMSTIYCDIYMHNPRGSNDRNCEKNENRQNANRLFDSQNNAKGGYACPRAVGAGSNTNIFYYYSGSVLPIQWTNQHQCGGDKTQCQVVIQTMCEKWVDNTNNELAGLRDGIPNTNTDTATETITAATVNDPRYGRHEPLDFYNKCSQRQRNLNLWTSDRDVNNNVGARGTRQNNNGNTHGFECPEERDYYPYWHPTPWIDIAYFTNNKTKCEEIPDQSENIVERYECSKPQHNNQKSCENDAGTWAPGSYTKALNIDIKNRIGKPECLFADETITSRDNYLGSAAQTGEIATYNWTIPDALEGMKCVIRIRYNISTGEIPFEIDNAFNKANSPVRQDLRSEAFGYAAHVELAMNTNQYGRTFQDRSYIFRVKKRDEKYNGRRIFNLNVRGKRGNIVQTFPAVEYDFVPNFLHVKYPDLVHIQWTGSDYNPARNPNDAEGGPLDPVDNQRRADRTNMFQCEGVSDISTNIPRGFENVTLFRDAGNNVDTKLVNHLAFPGIYDPKSPNLITSLCKKLAELPANDANARETDPRNCAKLNAAKTPYFDAGLVELRNNGYFCIVSTRNNNFSNRSQKGRLLVTGAPFDAASTSTISMAALLFAIVALLFIM